MKSGMVVVHAYNPEIRKTARLKPIQVKLMSSHIKKKGLEMWFKW
jgi:hypothetical protein